MPILADMNMATAMRQMPVISSRSLSVCSASSASRISSTAFSLSPSVVKTALPVFRLTREVADMTVQVAIPTVIIITETYLTVL